LRISSLIDCQKYTKCIIFVSRGELLIIRELKKKAIVNVVQTVMKIDTTMASIL